MSVEVPPVPWPCCDTPPSCPLSPCLLTLTPAPHAGLPDKISWVEKFVEVGRPASEAAKREHER